MIDHVAVVGGGFSGSLLAINLLRHEGPRVTLVERASAPGGGLAFGSADPEHLLNVRAANMSAFPDRPGHFVDWVAARGGGDGATFVPRTAYGAYLRELLEAVQAKGNGRLKIIRGDAADLSEGPGGYRLTLADGGTLQANAVALAMGNLPPHTPPPLRPEQLPPGVYFGDPWDPTATQGLSDHDTIFVIGTGLTMVDMVLLLDKQGFNGRTIALSRRGLLPHPHLAEPPAADRRSVKPTSVASHLLAETRARAAQVGWRHAVDELRPFTQRLWRSASRAEKGRFLRHLRPWWDVHRHRLAPQVHARLLERIADGRLSVHAGKMIAAEPSAQGAEIAWRVRGTDRVERAAVSRIINCTGPEGDLCSTTEPLLRSLMASGTIRPDPCGIGIDVDAQGSTLSADGSVNERLFALGPLTRGAFWEISAVPDIRHQVWDVARRLCNAHWVGGEGL